MFYIKAQRNQQEWITGNVSGYRWRQDADKQVEVFNRTSPSITYTVIGDNEFYSKFKDFSVRRRLNA
jgi:hypothetical protein